MTLRISFKTSPQRVDWATLDATWALAGELGGWDGAWMNDHLTDMDPDEPGPSLEAISTLATLVHHVPGLRVGHAVLSNTFRHPVVVAKAATVLDHATGGRLRAGPRRRLVRGRARAVRARRCRRSASGSTAWSARSRCSTALFSPEAASPPGVTRDDPFYPLRGATNIPPPLTPGGPPIFLGGQKPRGIRLAARRAAGLAADRHGGGPGRLLRRPARRDPRARSTPRAATRRRSSSWARSTPARTRRRGHGAHPGAAPWSRAGATELVVGIPAALGPAALETAAREVRDPLRDEFGPAA